MNAIIFGLSRAKMRFMLTIRPAIPADADSVWSIMEPVIRSADTYTLAADMSREEGLAYWCSKDHKTFVATEDDSILGTYYLRANQRGGGSHVANCGYMTSPQATGRGVARMMCAHSLELARTLGFKAMQFNFVVSSNDRAVRLWQANGFEIVGTLPKAFHHPALGYVDAYVMFRTL